MIVRPTRDLLGMLTTTPGQEHALFVECEVIRPPSSEGKRVNLWLDAAAVTDLLIALRDSAREARR